MFVEMQPTDPWTHQVAMRIAREFTQIVSAILMDHERPECIRQSYQVSRRGLEMYSKKPEANPTPVSETRLI
jgi:hypothetical protein